jgi:hypothetical protein
MSVSPYGQIRPSRLSKGESDGRKIIYRRSKTIVVCRSCTSSSYRDAGLRIGGGTSESHRSGGSGSGGGSANGRGRSGGKAQGH